MEQEGIVTSVLTGVVREKWILIGTIIDGID